MRKQDKTRHNNTRQERLNTRENRAGSRHSQHKKLFPDDQTRQVKTGQNKRHKKRDGKTWPDSKGREDRTDRNSRTKESGTR